MNDLASLDTAEWPHHFDQRLLQSMVTDLAQKIFTNTEIAARYGLELDELWVMLQRPAVLRMFKRAKALWESDTNAETRTRMIYLMGVEQAAPAVCNSITDPNLSPAQRAEFLKLSMRVAGVDGLPNQQREGAGGSGIAPVSISMHFSGGRTESVTTVVSPASPIIENEAA